MGIYTRDQIQYANMLQNALQNRARAIEREGDNLRGRGQMWGSALNTAGNTVKDALFSIASYQHGDQEAQKQRDFTAEQAALRAKEALERQNAQMDFQSAENALNRKNTMDIALLNKQRADQAAMINPSKAQLDAEIAQAEYDDAVKRVDMSKPETITAAKKAALKLNYANSLLPYFDKEVFQPVQTDFEQDSPEVAKTKRVDSAVALLNGKLKKNKYLNADETEVNSAMDVLRAEAPDLAEGYEASFSNKGPTKEKKEAAFNAQLGSAIENKNKSQLPAGYSVRSFGGQPFLAKKDKNGNWVKAMFNGSYVIW